MDRQAKDVFEPASTSNDKQRAALIEWLNSSFSDVSLSVNASDEDLRAFLIDGSVLCRILNKVKPGSVIEAGGSDNSLKSGLVNVKRFLAAMDELGLPRFQIQDLEKGSMKIVIDCLLTLRAKSITSFGRYGIPSTPNTPSTPIISSVTSSANESSVRWKPLVERYGNGDASPGAQISRSSTILGDDKWRCSSDSKYQRASHSPVMSESSATLIHQVGHKFHEVFQMKHGGYADLPPAKLSEMMKSNSLDNAPTQSLLSVVNGILNESVERKNGEIPYRVACLLRKVVQEIERRISTQAEHLRTQNNMFKAREEKYKSRIKVLEALASGTSEETQVVMNKLQQVKTEKTIIEEQKKVEDQDVERLIKQKDSNQHEIESLKQDLETAKKNHEQDLATAKKNHEHEVESLKKELETVKETYDQLRLQIETQPKEGIESKETQEIISLKKELETAKKNYEKVRLQLDTDDSKGAHEILSLKQELKISKNKYEQRCQQMESEAQGVQKELEEKLKEAENRLKDSKNRVEKLEAYTESKSKQWNKKLHIYQVSTEVQLGALRELKVSSQAIRQEIVKTQKSYLEEFSHLGIKIKKLENAAENYYAVLAENRKMHNELQDLKGNIRVYCRIRPFLPGQKGRQSIVEHTGDNGELVVSNPSKQGKESQRSFKFNKVYNQAATQANVYSDTRPLIQSVLDGYNVCIFAYGQTGSGKTYTMMGPDNATEEDWGVNYRALNDLFNISQKRASTFSYEIGVQMVEIYNEQVRDLLASGGVQKKLGIVTSSQSSGLAVPDACMQTVQSTSDVLDLMEIGFKNRAKGSTAMNERSSRSHSVLTVHVRGTDLKSNAVLRSSLHLVDLAGSERVDRSEATGDRLKEAQHINKSLAALGDVIFALAQKSSHVPYRNSKLTQVLQTSLGGQAKTLMFVQLNPDVSSFTESLSTLKFAERVSGVELGAAKSSKEGRDVRELMEQVNSLKDTIAKKDDEIQLLKDTKNVNQGVNGDKRPSTSTRHGSSPSVQSSTGSTPQRSSKVSVGKTLRAASDQENYAENNDKNSKSFGGNEGQDDTENLEYDDGENEERSSDISDSGVSFGTDTEGSVEGSILQEGAKPSDYIKRSQSTVRAPRPALKSSTQKSTTTDATKVSTGLRKSPSGNSLSFKSAKRLP